MLFSASLLKNAGVSYQQLHTRRGKCWVAGQRQRSALMCGPFWIEHHAAHPLTCSWRKNHFTDMMSFLSLMGEFIMVCHPGKIQSRKFEILFYLVVMFHLQLVCKIMISGFCQNPENCSFLKVVFWFTYVCVPHMWLALMVLCKSSKRSEPQHHPSARKLLLISYSY